MRSTSSSRLEATQTLEAIEAFRSASPLRAIDEREHLTESLWSLEPGQGPKRNGSQGGASPSNRLQHLGRGFGRWWVDPEHSDHPSRASVARAPDRVGRNAGVHVFPSRQREHEFGRRPGTLSRKQSGLNMLARGIWASHRKRGLTVLSIHPGWACIGIGTLGGTVELEIELEPSVPGVADVPVRHMGSGETLYRDYEDKPLSW